MKSVRAFICRCLGCGFLAAMFLAAAPPATATSKPLLVYYMPWFVAKPYSPQWGWHWTMDHFNPEIVDATGVRQIASWYHPLIGPYDSADPAVLEYHVLLMKLAGIDGMIVDWYSADNYLDYQSNNERTLAVFEFARKAGLQFGLCYEDRTIQQQVTDGGLPATRAIAHAQETMRYIESHYFQPTNYLRWNDRPVLLNFGPQYFKTNEDWVRIFSALQPTNQPAFFTEDNRLPVGVGAFDWPPMWLSASPGARGVLATAALESYLAAFERNAANWPAFISSAFPRFHDIYQPAGVRNYWGYLGDRKGDMLRMTLGRALTNHSALVQVVSWNDFGEGTMIEPTVEYGYRDLAIIQELRRTHLEPGFAFRTNDLPIAERFYRLRRGASTNRSFNAVLDLAFTNVISGNLPAAQRLLDGLAK